MIETLATIILATILVVIVLAVLYFVIAVGYAVHLALHIPKHEYNDLDPSDQGSLLAQTLALGMVWPVGVLLSFIDLVNRFRS